MAFYIHVPYSEKDDAKALGARWDAKLKSWYVPHGVKTRPFKRWWRSPLSRSMTGRGNRGFQSRAVGMGR